MTEDTCCCAFSRSLQRILPGLNLLLTVLLLVLTPALLSRAQEAASTPAPGTPGGPIAQVNDQVLTEAAFHSRCERLVGGQADTAAGWVALKDWIQQTLAEEEAKKKNLVPNDQAIARRVDALRKQWEFRGVKFTEWLEEHGRSLDSVRTDVRSQLIAENLLTEGIEVKEAEVALFYANNKQVFGIPEQIKV
ncbi:MAG: hypothetical protein FJX77_02315, partial [Armatimonadetes bacterium]|nr:hypothetical protein [Armatimonadota bacterium]